MVAKRKKRNRKNTRKRGTSDASSNSILLGILNHETFNQKSFFKSLRSIRLNGMLVRIRQKFLFQFLVNFLILVLFLISVISSFIIVMNLINLFKK